jgi:DNA mismatch repair protein MutH
MKKRSNESGCLLPVELETMSFDIVDYAHHPFIALKPLIVNLGFDWEEVRVDLQARAKRWNIIEIPIQDRSSETCIDWNKASGMIAWIVQEAPDKRQIKKQYRAILLTLLKYWQDNAPSSKKTKARAAALVGALTRYFNAD